MPQDDRVRLGRLGEEMALLVYRAAGYDVTARRWRRAEGELDLVLRRGDVLVFCEVKTRRGTGCGDPAAAVDRRRCARIRRVARRFLAEHALTGVREFRFDVAAVLISARGEGAAISLLQGVL